MFVSWLQRIGMSPELLGITMSGTSGAATHDAPVPQEATTATGSGAAEHTASAASPPHQGVPWFLDTHRLAQKPSRYRVKFYGKRKIAK